MDKSAVCMKAITSELKELYLKDSRPWIVGLSGGKDSTCITQLIYNMLLELTPAQRHKKVHIISSNTLVESPFIDSMIKIRLNRIKESAIKDDLPVIVEQLRPDLNDTFWVNLIGRGYPSPNRWFRWCTDRLKIKPTTKYILNQVKSNGEVIIVLGARKSESDNRAHTMSKYEIPDFRLKKHTEMSGAYVYTPIEDLDVDQVWNYLLQEPSPWGDNNSELKSLYKKADKEINFMLDKKAPPSGGSRFGCWVCTVVERDRSLEGLIEDGEAWLGQLLEFRNWLKIIRDDPSFREKMRKKDLKKKAMAGKMGEDFSQSEHRGHKTLGPFTFEARHEILRRLVELQDKVAEKNISIISPEEIKAIEMLWIYEGDSISSVLDIINPHTTKLNNSKSIQDEIIVNEILQVLCAENGISQSLIDQLLVVEKDLSSLSRRNGIYDRLEQVIQENISNSEIICQQHNVEYCAECGCGACKRLIT